MLPLVPIMMMLMPMEEEAMSESLFESDRFQPRRRRCL